MENPIFFWIFSSSPLPSYVMFAFALLACPLCRIISPIVCTFSAVCYAVAALFCDIHGRCFCASVSVLYVCFCTWRVCCHRHARRSKNAVCFFFKNSRSALQPRNQQTTLQHQRYNRSRSPSSRLCASSHGVCVWLVHKAVIDRACAMPILAQLNSTTLPSLSLLQER